MSWSKGQQVWRAQIEVNGKGRHLGYFKDEEEAAELPETGLFEHIERKTLHIGNLSGRGKPATLVGGATASGRGASPAGGKPATLAGGAMA